MSESVKFYRNPDFILREIGGESLLVPVGQNNAFDNSMITLNETFVYLWKLFQKPITLEAAIEGAKKEYDDDKNGNEIEKSVRQFVEESLHYGLLIREESK